MFRNHFVSLAYALSRAESDRGLLGHVAQPAKFLLQEFSFLLPGLILAAVLVSRPLSQNRLHLSGPRNAFLLVASVGPFLTLLGLSILFGFRIQRMWGTPLWSFSGTLAASLLCGNLDTRRLRRFGYSWSCYQAALLIEIGRAHV